MDISGIIKIVSYTKVPRSALPADINDSRSVCNILREQVKYCIDDGSISTDTYNKIRIIPGVDYNYDTSGREIMYFMDDDPKKKYPRVNLAFASRNNEKYRLRDKDWIYSAMFEKNTAMFVELHEIKSYDCKFGYHSGGDEPILSVLKTIGIDSADTSSGWLLIGNGE